MLDIALDYARDTLEADARRVRLAELKFRQCEGYYSKSAHACIWPCSITEADPNDQMAEVYEALVHWADVILVATPIRWGNASALYYKMIALQKAIRDIPQTRRKASFFGGLKKMFFSEIGCHFPQFPFIAHSRGWSAEDMEHNIDYVMKSEDLREGAKMLVARAIDMAELLLEHEKAPHVIARGGRKAHQLSLAGA